MRAFLERVAATLSAHEMLAREQVVLVAFSGGADSTALLHTLHTLGYRVAAAHVHHGLRGEEAEADAAHAAASAASLGVPFAVRRAEARAVAEAQKLSLETAAREVRYRLLEEMRAELKADRIATGHTADDQAETVLLNLLRGAGPAGLSGIPPVRGAILRPLLAVTHTDVLAYCEAAGLAYRTDSSNTDRHFTRNRIRHEILPSLTAIQPQVGEVLARLAEIMRAENALLGSLVEQTMEGMVTWGEGEARVSRRELQALPKALQRRVLRRVVAVTQHRETDIEFERIEALVELAARGHTGGVIELPGGLRATRGYGEITVSPAQEQAAVMGEWTLPVPGEVLIPDLGLAVQAIESVDIEVVDDPTQAVVDAGTVRGPLTARTWRPGDRFVPLGLTKPVKLQDFFVNAKVPRAERHRILLVLSQGEIVWVVGHRIGDSYRVTPSTRRTVRLRVTRD
jgi:tRNA(Ile)-lysidine synthase